MTRSKRTMIAVCIASALAIAACSNDSDSEGASPPTEATQPDDDSTTTETPTTEATTTTEDPLGGASTEDLAELWQQMMQVSALPADERIPAIEALGDAIHPVVANGVVSMIPEAIERDVYTYPIIGDADNQGRIAIEDCILYVPAAMQRVAWRHSGNATPDGDGGWIIDKLSRIDETCVPGELNAAVLEDYDEFRQAQIDYWNPADPDHPGIEQTTTGDYRDFVRDNVLRGQVEGFTARNEREHSPEVVEVISDEWLVIEDCYEANPEGGLFDLDGERLPGTDARDEGERDLSRVTMKLEEGQWKVAELFATLGDECMVAPTPKAATVVDE